MDSASRGAGYGRPRLFFGALCTAAALVGAAALGLHSISSALAAAPSATAAKVARAMIAPHTPPARP